MAAKELIAVLDGYRESEQSWSELLLDLKQRGLTIGTEAGRRRRGAWASGRRSARSSPKLVSNAAGFTRRPTCSTRCPRVFSPKPKADLHEIWQAETKDDANKAFDDFLEKYEAKYPPACECLTKDRDVLLTFYDFPAEHWSHLRTTNPIESTFATIRLRHRRTKGSGTRRASLAMMFKLAQSASKKWRRLNCHEKITLVIEGRSFKDGIMQDEIAA